MTWTAETALYRAGSEIAELLTDHDAGELRRILGQFGPQRALELLYEQSDVAQAMLRMPATQRRAYLKSESGGQAGRRTLLLYAALAWAHRLQHLIAALESSNLAPNDRAKWALPAALQLGASLASDDWLWPLPGPSPFEELDA